MIENFEAVKKQLSQLAGVINSFKSEAVQLKIIELIFGESGSFEEDTPDDEKPKGKRKVRRKTVTKKEQGGGRISTSKKKTMGGTGAVATVTQLATGEFFI